MSIGVSEETALLNVIYSLYRCKFSTLVVLIIQGVT